MAAAACSCCASPSASRPGYFSYRIDLEAMTQENARTGKVRAIRRFTKTVMEKSAKKRAAKRSPADRKKVAKTILKTKSKPKAREPSKTRKTSKPSKPSKAAKAKAPKVKVATGKDAKAQVFQGKFTRTSTGLKKRDLKKNKYGKVVSKRLSEAGWMHLPVLDCVFWSHVSPVSPLAVVLIPEAGRTSLGLLAGLPPARKPGMSLALPASLQSERTRMHGFVPKGTWPCRSCRALDSNPSVGPDGLGRSEHIRIIAIMNFIPNMVTGLPRNCVRACCIVEQVERLHLVSQWTQRCSEGCV